MSLPQQTVFEGREVPLYTFKQLEQQPRQKLKSRAMDLRDIVGADRLPPLRAAGSVEEVCTWILEVQSMIAKSAGLELTPVDFGLPPNFGLVDEEFLNPAQTKTHSSSMQRQPMQELQQGPGSGAIAAYESAMDAAAATRAKNQRGSNIFG